MILPCNRGTAAVFEAIKRGLEQGAATPAGVTLTVVQPHSPFPFARSIEGSRNSGGSRGKMSRSQHRDGLAMSSSGGAGEGDQHFGDVIVGVGSQLLNSSMSCVHCAQRPLPTDAMCERSCKAGMTRVLI